MILWSDSSFSALPIHIRHSQAKHHQPKTPLLQINHYLHELLIPLPFVLSSNEKVSLKARNPFFPLDLFISLVLSFFVERRFWQKKGNCSETNEKDLEHSMCADTSV